MTDTRRTDIAVIGLACRMPAARDAAEFWQNLRDGRECIRRFSADELAEAGVDPQTLERRDFVPAGASIEGVELFDAEFFGMNPREADILDPQQRLFLETAWLALEDAGCDPERSPGPVGVYAGESFSFYLFRVLASEGIVERLGPTAIMLAQDKDFLATRAAYAFDLRGPALTIQTACSTSLVAVATACSALAAAECDVALAGGSSVRVPQAAGYFYREGGISSPDGRCRAFDAGARGTVGGNGVGVVVLKRLEDALADRDPIRAVIRGWATNNDGRAKIGFTAPSQTAQSEVIATALSFADVDPESVGYVEAHGTGTPLGDPIEIAALGEVFRGRPASAGRCALGALKASIGHLDAAAGVAGLLKVILALENATLPPVVGLETPNPALALDRSPFFLPRRATHWAQGAAPRRAGVSSFGIGGTNAHLVLEEAPAVEAAGSARDAHLLVLSARSKTSLESRKAALSARLSADPALDLGDVAFTCLSGRKEFAERGALVCRDRRDALEALCSPSSPRWLEGNAASPASVVLMFPGQGAQRPGMFRALPAAAPAFGEALQAALRLVSTEIGRDAAQLMASASAEELERTELAQPLLFAVGYALGVLWESWGIAARALVGHSVGEFVAACLAGVMNLEDAVPLICARGRLIQALPPGAMLAVPFSESEAVALAGDGLDLAAVNGPSACVLAGPVDAVAALEERLSQAGTPGRRQRTSHAFHSRMMQPALEPFGRVLAHVRLSPPRCPVVSTLTGRPLGPEEATSHDHWLRHVVEPVRFSEALESLAADSRNVFLELGPGRALSGVARSVVGGGRRVLAVAGAAGSEADPSLSDVLAVAGELFCRGVRLDAAGLYRGERRRKLALPGYSFERKRHWIDAPPLVRSSAPPSSVRFYAPGWTLAPLPPPELPSEGTWLILEDETGLGARIASRLRDAGVTVVSVRSGNRFNEDSADFVVDPAAKDDYEALLDVLERRGSLPDNIVHAWNVAPVDPFALSPHAVEESLSNGFYSLVELAQALARRGRAAPVRLLALSTHVHTVTGAEALVPTRATLLGACRVLPQEIPWLSCRHVDLDPGGSWPPGPGVVEALLAELAVQTPGSSVIAYRDDRRWVEADEPLGPPATRGVRLRPGGVYMLTGGFGGMCLAIARHLARGARARLVLVARQALPPREAWDDAIARGEDAEVVRRILAVRGLEELGSEVLPLAADVTDAAQMASALAETQARFGALHGVLHAAGVPGGGLLQFKTREAARDVMAPKLQGTLVLGRLLQGLPLDWLVLCSSLSALVGGVGRGDYAAANAFLDAYARAFGRGSARHRVVSIDWDTWRESGMAVSAQRRAGDAGALERGLGDEQGAEAFLQALAFGRPQVAVCQDDLAAVRAHFRAGPLVSARSAFGAPSPNTSGIAPQHAPPVGHLEQVIAALWEDLLGIAPIGRDGNFFELGGHSLLGIQFVARLKDRHGVEVAIAQLFEAPTVAALAALVGGESAGALAEALTAAEALSDEDVTALLSSPESTA